MNEVIIDGVNVAECEFYTDRLFTNSDKGCSAYARDCDSEYSKNCYYKQLKRLAELIKANRCHHYVLSECSQEHHDNCVGHKQCILDLEQIISNLKAENEKLKDYISEANSLYKYKNQI